jgi:hypothetical protein
MAKFEDDELDVIPTKTAVTTPAAEAETEAPAETPAKAETKTAVAADEDEDLDVDFGDQKLMAKGDGLNRIRAEKGKVVRFALLDFVKPKKGYSHFVDTKDKKGTFRCAPVKTEGEIPYCCAKLEEEGQQHVVALALLYTNADPKTGKYEKGASIDWEVGYVDLSRSNYRAVSGLAPEDTSVYDIDMVMSKKDNGIGYEFTLASVKARWKLNPDLGEEVKAAAAKFVNDGGKKLIGKLGRKQTPIEWKALLSGQAASGKEADLSDIEDM